MRLPFSDGSRSGFLNSLIDLNGSAYFMNESFKMILKTSLFLFSPEIFLDAIASQVNTDEIGHDSPDRIVYKDLLGYAQFLFLVSF